MLVCQRTIIDLILLLIDFNIAETLFGFIAESLGDFAPETRGAAQPTLLGFTFSFPVTHTSISRGVRPSCRVYLVREIITGVLTNWTKGFSAAGCVGEDATELLERELAKRVRAKANDMMILDQYYSRLDNSNS